MREERRGGRGEKEREGRHRKEGVEESGEEGEGRGGCKKRREGKESMTAH